MRRPPTTAGAPSRHHRSPRHRRRARRDLGRHRLDPVRLVFLGLGLWFFVDQTLGYELPRIRWSQLWPVVLIVIGVWVVVGSMRRGSR